MPEVIQRAFGVLWPLMLALVIGYMAYDAQIGPFSTFLVPSTWFLFSYMLVFPRSQPAAVLVYCFGKLNDAKVKALIFIFATFLLFHSFHQYAPVGMIYIVAFGIIDVCIIQRNAYRAAMESPILLLGDSRQPDTAAAEEEDSVNTTPDTGHESSVAAEPDTTAVPDQSAEPEQPIEPDQLDSADPSDGPSAEEAVQPKSWARSAMNILWFFLWSLLCVILKLGAAALVAHILIEVLLKGWALTPTPVESTPLFETEVIIQANKTQLPIPVPMAEFIPTGTFASPCQAAHTPIPVAKSIVTVMATPMPTPMPAPTPSDMPEPVPEPVAVPDEAFELLNRLFDFDIPDPKPLLAWYFDLPPSSQYAVVVASLLVLWCLSKPLAILAPELIVLVIDYFAAAAMLPLLFRYGFDRKQSMLITLAADCVLNVSIWYGKSRLWNLKALCRSNTASLADVKSQSEDNASGLADLRSQVRDNAAGLAGLESQLVEVVRLNMLESDGTKTWLTSTSKMLHSLSECFVSVSHMVAAQARRVRHHATEIHTLNKQMTTKADLYQTIRILEQLSGKIDGLDTSKADAGLLRGAQEELELLRSLVENLQAENVDAAVLERVQEDLVELRGNIINLQNTKADAGEFPRLLSQAQKLIDDLTETLDIQEQLGTDVDTLMNEMEGARTNISSLDETRTQHGTSISRLEQGAKDSKNAFNGLNGKVGQWVRDKQQADQKISKLEKENSDLRQENDNFKRDFGKLQGTVEDMQKRMEAMDAREGKHEQDLTQLRDDVTSDTSRKVDQLRSDANLQHQQAMQAHKKLEDSVDERFTKSAQDVKEARDKATSLHKEAMDSQQQLSNTFENRLQITDVLADHVQDDLKEYKDAVNIRFDGFSTRIEAANAGTSKALQRVEAVESRAGGFIEEHQLDDYIRSTVKQFVEDFLVSDKFRAAVNEAQLTLKKQSQRDRLRDQIHELTEEFLGEAEIQERIYANIIERRARDDNNLPGDPPGVVPGGWASSPGIGPSNPHAAPDNTIGHDDPLGDPPGVISGGQATLPGDMSSDNTTTPTIPEESTIPDDVDDHHGTRGVPLGDPAEVCLRGRAASRGGSMSDGPSCDGGTGPRPSGEDDDGTLQPKRREGNKSCEPGEQPHGPANSEQPGGEQDEETDEDEEDDDNDDEARDGGDDDESDDGPPGPPPGSSGGSNGHNGTGGNDNDGHGGDNGGAPRPFTGTGNFRGALGLANSRYAAEPSSEPGPSHSQDHAAEVAEHTDGTRQKTKKAFEDRSENRRARDSKQWDKFSAKKAAAREEKKKNQEQNNPTQGQSQPTQKQPKSAQNHSMKGPNQQKQGQNQQTGKGQTQ